MTIKMTSIPVEDPIKAFEIYTKILGFQELMYMPEGQLAIVVSKDDPKGTALLLEPRGDGFAKTFQETVYQQNLPIIVFGVADVETEYQRLSALGIKFTKNPEKTAWGTIANFEDGCGNIVQIHQD